MNQNTVILEGVLAREPRAFDLPSGKRTVRATVVIERSFNSSEGEKVLTDYVDVTFWGKSADAIMPLTGGTPLQVTGRVRTGSYEKNGEKRWITEIVAEGFAVLEEAGAGAAVAVTPVAKAAKPVRAYAGARG